MVDFIPLTVAQADEALDALADYQHPDDAARRCEIIQAALGDFAGDYHAISGCVLDLRRPALADLTDASLCDLPLTHIESRSFVAYNLLIGVEPERAYERPLRDLAGEAYCRFLAVMAMRGCASPPDVEHFYRLSFDSGFDAARQDASARRVDQYYMTLREINHAKRRPL